MSEREIDEVKESGYSQETKISPTSQQKMVYLCLAPWEHSLAAFTAMKDCFQADSASSTDIVAQLSDLSTSSYCVNVANYRQIAGVNRQKQGLYNSPFPAHFSG